MCTLEKLGSLYILTLTGQDEHRLNPTLLDSIQSALRQLQAEPYSPSSALITTADGKFFSNGLDLAWAHASASASTAEPRFNLMLSKLRSVVSALISLPIPTIAAVTGHAAGGGFILAASHDYLVMRKDRGFLYMSEIDIGVVIPAWCMTLLECKIGDWNVRRELVLAATKLTAEMAVARGIVQSAHDSAERTVEAAVEFGERLTKRGWDGQVYAKNRMVALRQVLDKIEFDVSVERQNCVVTASKL